MMEQLAAMPPLLEVPGMRKSLMWGIGCGILGAIHRLRQGKGPLLSASRGIACFGTAFAVSWFAESRAEARDQVLQQRVKDALQKTREKDAQAARLPASSAASSTSTVGSATTVSSISDNSNSQPHIEFTDTDGDRICFRIDARTCQLVYEVNGSVRIHNVTDLRSEARPDGSVAIFLTEGDDPAAGRGTVVPGSQSNDEDGAGDDRSSGERIPGSSGASRTGVEIEALFEKARSTPANPLQ